MKNLSSQWVIVKTLWPDGIGHDRFSDSCQLICSLLGSDRERCGTQWLVQFFFFLFFADILRNIQRPADHRRTLHNQISPYSVLVDGKDKRKTTSSRAQRRVLTNRKRRIWQYDGPRRGGYDPLGTFGLTLAAICVIIRLAFATLTRLLWPIPVLECSFFTEDTLVHRFVLLIKV